MKLFLNVRMAESTRECYFILTYFEFIFGFFFFKYLVTPAIVPPDPIAQINPSTFPHVCSHISGPVVLKWAFKFEVLSN